MKKKLCGEGESSENPGNTFSPCTHCKCSCMRQWLETYGEGGV